ncbi:hypothetical protein DVA67_008710 [Solirubrobacter sp. CPCC 204708]|uniref:Transmembrane protein n=1 Tax=Solirubrobacter deserti TaxID=2282478 RepID=A0ABT4REL6_9ACTN|nr:hypothetical protein [Solirubrobacter deserti]MBE2316054.1 hypothetical protein [Solirubrobacter deserti]MDA0136806.1 hypothetical protein [Solirubrobacter deserti]
MNRAALGLFSLLLLFGLLPWSAAAFLLLLFGLQPYESDGLCYAARPLWAGGQALVALPGLYISGKAAVSGMATAAQGRQDTGTRWQWLGYGLLAFGVWVLVLFALEPEGTRVAASECRDTDD